MHRGSNNSISRITDKGFLDSLLEFIRSAESELDIMLPHSSALHLLSYYKVIDYLITQRRQKDILIRLICAFDDNTSKIIRKMVPFLGYKSIKPASTQAEAIPLVFIRDKQDIFSISINKHQYDKKSVNDTESENIDNSIFSVDDWMYSKNISLVKNLVSSF